MTPERPRRPQNLQQRSVLAGEAAAAAAEVETALSTPVDTSARTRNHDPTPATRTALTSSVAVKTIQNVVPMVAQ